MSGYRARVWQSAWPNDPLPPTQRLTLVSEPQMPEQPVASWQPLFLAIGTVVGLLAAWLIWRPRRNFKLAGFALLGAVLTFAASFAIGDRYTSRAVIRMGPLLTPKRLVSALEPEPRAERFHRLQEQVMAPEVLETIATSARLRAARAVEAMRNGDLRITPAGADAFVVSFTYSDRYKAQNVVRALCTQLVERDAIQHRTLPADNPEVRRAWEMRIGSPLEVLDPASLPEAPVFPNRVAIGAIGLPLGLLVGVYRQRRKRAVQTA